MGRDARCQASRSFPARGVCELWQQREALFRLPADKSSGNRTFSAPQPIALGRVSPHAQPRVFTVTTKAPRKPRKALKILFVIVGLLALVGTLGFIKFSQI